MKIALYTNDQRKTLIVKEKIINLIESNPRLSIDDKDPQIVISIGGDGTFLGAFHKYSYCIDNIKLIGVHTGHLGFYTNWPNTQLNKLIDLISNTLPQVVSYPILNVDIEYLDGKSDSKIALNESTIRKSDCKTEIANVYIEDKLFEEFRGDGLCISTPSGSTAYNKSVGGAIIDPEIEVYQMAEIASLNNVLFPTLTSPVIIPKNKKIHIELVNPCNTSLTIDQSLIKTPIKSLTFSLSKSKVNIAYYDVQNIFWEKVRHSFIKPNK